MRQEIKTLDFEHLPSTHLWCHDHLPALFASFLSPSLQRPAKLVSVRAREQTKGIGRRSLQEEADSEKSAGWSSPPGGLYLSCVAPLPPPSSIPPQEIASLSPLMIQQNLVLLSLELMEALASELRRGEGAPVSLRWPNDLITPRGKIGGTLLSKVTLSHEGQQQPLIILSVGLNVAKRALSQTNPQAPPHPPHPPRDALAHYDPRLEEEDLAQQRITNLTFFLAETLCRLLSKYLPRTPLTPLPSQEKAAHHFWLRQGMVFPAHYSWIDLSLSKKPRSGAIVGIDGLGRLRLKDNHGTITSLDAAQVHRLRLVDQAHTH